MEQFIIVMHMNYSPTKTTTGAVLLNVYMMRPFRCFVNIYESPAVLVSIESINIILKMKRKATYKSIENKSVSLNYK